MDAPEIAEETEGDDQDGPDDHDDVAGDALEAAEEETKEASGDTTAPEPSDDPDVAEVDLTDDDLAEGKDDLFTGTEEASSSDGDDSSSESDDSDDSDEQDDGDALDALDQRGEGMEEAINDGAARLAVVGLDDDGEKEDLEDEFVEVFESFRLGYFGSRFMEEYVFTADDDEVDPVWGLFGAALCCTAIVVWMRPDGDEMVDRAKEAVEGIAGGSLP